METEVITVTINERVKYLRKDILHMNQTEFALSIGMKQTSVSSFEKEGATVSDQSIKAISSIHGIREDWLRTGKEPIYKESKTFNLDAFAKDRGASDLELEIMKAYFELDPEIRHSVLDHFKQKLSATNSNSEEDVFTALSKVPDTPEELEKLYPPVDVSIKHKIG